MSLAFWLQDHILYQNTAGRLPKFCISVAVTLQVRYVQSTMTIHPSNVRLYAKHLCKKISTFRHCLLWFKVKESCNRPGVAQSVPGGLDSQIAMTFSMWRWWGCQPHAPATFIPRKCSWYSLSLGAESTPGPWYGWKEYVTEKSSDTTRNRSRGRPTSSTAS